MLVVLVLPLDADHRPSVVSPAACAVAAASQDGTPSAQRGERPTANSEAEPPEAGHPVPEAATLLLVGTGLVGIALSSRRRNRRLE